VRRDRGRPPWRRAVASRTFAVSTPGIYGIENWSGHSANRNSVLPVLGFLATSGAARFIHERVSTLSELEHGVDDWAPRKQHQILLPRPPRVGRRGLGRPARTKSR